MQPFVAVPIPEADVADLETIRETRGEMKTSSEQEGGEDNDKSDGERRPCRRRLQWPGDRPPPPPGTALPRWPSPDGGGDSPSGSAENRRTQNPHPQSSPPGRRMTRRGYINLKQGAFSLSRNKYHEISVLLSFLFLRWSTGGGGWHPLRRRPGRIAAPPVGLLKKPPHAP